MDSKNVKTAIIAALLGLVVVIVLMQFTGFVSSLVGGLVGAVLAFFIGYSVFKEKIIEDIKSDLKEEVVVQDPSDKAIDSLIALEEHIALADVDLENEIATKVTLVTDSLISVIPEMNQKFSSQAITFEVTNMGEEHFPNRIKSFLTLTEDDRNSQKLKLLSDLQKMEVVIKKVDDVIKNDSLNKDERESLLAQIKYGAI